MQLVHLKTNHLTNPLGFRISHPVFTWNAESTGKLQQQARVEISSDEKFSAILYDSGLRDDISCTGFTPEFNPAPASRYFWRVTVIADNGDSGTSNPAWFETPPAREDWQAEWIAAPFSKFIQPVFQKSFLVSGEIRSARAYATAAGIYELSFNGEKAGNEFLLPGYHAYDFWQQYQSFDITELIKSGENTVSACLGNGWYKGRFGFKGDECNYYGDTCALICRIVITMADGTEQIINTDTSWRAHSGNCLDSGIYDGETVDGTIHIPGLNQFNGEKNHTWADSVVLPIGTDKLSPRLSPPITYQESFKPAQILVTPAGETVLDFGQEVTGWVEFVCRAPKGKKLVLRYGETLQDGCFSQANLRSAKAAFTYISDGNNETVRPRFTFFGFRYVKLEGFSVPDSDDFMARVIHSDLEQIGHIKTSNPLVNRLFLNSLWGQKGNFVDVPTDCPQRDERMGWTGDAQVFCTTACMNMDAAAFYAKYMHDMFLEQKASGGSVPHVVPLLKRDGQPLLGKDSCAWSDAAVIIPWTVYQMTGDRALLEEEYDSMKMWIDRIIRYDEEDGNKRLWQTGFHFADWLALDNYRDPSSSFGGTDNYYVASAFYAYSAGLTAKAAAVLGKKEDADFYAERAREVKAAMLKEYFTPSGRCAIDTQTAYVLALFMELTPESMRPRLVSELRRKLRENDMKLTTGFVGTPYLCRVLSQYGANEDAYTLLLNEELPGWLYEIKMGATTVWERWNSILPDGHFSDLSMNSLNHYAYGSIAEWMYRWMCGLNPSENAPGFHEAVLTPRPDKRIGFAKAEIRTASGLYESGWEYQPDGSILYTFRVPFNCKALLKLASFDHAELDGRPVHEPVMLDAGVHTVITH